MGLDKASSKSGGFFHLFDWNKKSRKKLFASGTVSPGLDLSVNQLFGIFSLVFSKFLSVLAVESKQKTHVNIYGQTIRAPNFVSIYNFSSLLSI